MKYVLPLVALALGFLPLALALSGAMALGYPLLAVSVACTTVVLSL